jgi:MFS family permease
LDSTIASARSGQALPATAPGETKASVYGWAVIVLFGLANAVAFMDRGFLSLVVEPVRQSLKLSDVQIGVLIGPAFILFYSLVALPIGWLSDRTSRKRIIVLGVLFWSGCMAWTGTAQRFSQLLSARMGIGVGEATLNPAAISIISDLVPRNTVSKAVALFIAIGALGAGLGSILGGLLLGWLGRSHGLGGLPLIGAMAPWRQAFVLLGLPGLVLALLMIVLVREPDRSKNADRAGAFGWRETGAYLIARRGSTLYIMFGFALISALPAVGAWTPAFLARTYGWTPAHIGPLFGLVQLLTNPAGIFLGGLVSDGLRRRGTEDGNMRVILLCLVAAFPFFLLFPLMPSGDLSLLVYAPANFFMMVCFGASTPVIPLLVPKGMRAQALAIMFLTANLIGSLAPLAIPMVTQYWFGDPKALRFALLLMPVVICPSSFVVLLGRRRAFIDQVLGVALGGDALRRATVAESASSI